MDGYLFLPFFIRIYEGAEQIALPADSLCLIFVLQGYFILRRGERYRLHVMDLFSIQTTDEDCVVFEDGREAACALICVSMDYISSQCQFMRPQIRINSTRRGQYSYQKLYSSVTRLLTDYFLEHSSRSRLMADIGRISHEMLSGDALAWEGTAGQQMIRGNKLRYLMNQEYQREWSLGALAQELELTVQYTSSYVRQILGLPMNRYLQNRRLAALVKYLVYTNESVTALAGIVGFANLVSLNQAFKEEYGQTPTQYRKAYQASEGMDIIYSDNPHYKESRIRMKQMAGSFIPRGQAVHKKEIRYRADGGGSSALPVMDTAFVGRTELLLWHSVCEQLDKVCRSIPVRYIRINTVFWPPNMVLDEKSGRYDFCHSFPAIQVLREKGLYPMILFRIDSAEPTDRMMENFLEQVLWQFGRNYVEQWRFECLLADYNQPIWELSAQKRMIISQKLEAVYSMIRNVSETIEIGLYLYNAERIRSDNEELLEIACETGVEWDFITVDLLASYIVRADRYMADTDTEYRFSANPYYLFQKIRTFHRILEGFYPDRQIALYGNVILNIHRHFVLNDTSYAAVFFLFHMLKCSDYLTGMMLPALMETTDYHKDLQDGRLTHGVFSLFADQGMPKPVFFALQFAAMLQKPVLQMGDYYVLTGDLDREFSLLLFHYEHPTLFFCNHPYNLSVDDVEAVFHETEPDEVKVTLPVYGKTYVMEQYTLDQEHGSILGLSWELDSSVILPGEVITHIREQLSPGYALRGVTAGKAGLSFELTLPAHTMVLVRMSVLETDS